MAVIDLNRLRLRPGDVRRERVDVQPEPFLLGGQRYEAHPETVPVDVEITQASGATIFDLRLHAHLTGTVHALSRVRGGRGRRASEGGPRPDGAARRRAPLRLRGGGRAPGRRLGPRRHRARVPEQVLCREECAGLCGVCGKDLNVEPHEHADRELDPRWAALESLRDQL